MRLAANEATLKNREAAGLRDAYIKLGEDLKKRIRRASGLSAQRDTVEKLELQVREMSSTLYKSQLDQWTGSRVELVQPADIPPQTDFRRWMLIIGAGALAFCVTGVGVGAWEYFKKRINSVRDVSDRMRIGVVGTLPKLSGQSWLGRKSPTELESLLGNSIDSIRAALMHGAECGRRGAVMITSAWDGEGKTTVASQLAVSLARCGRRTLLVDADLRNPTLHQLFEMPLGRGLGEVLRGDIEVEDCIRATQAENLKLLSAGTSDYTSIQALGERQRRRRFRSAQGAVRLHRGRYRPGAGLRGCVAARAAHGRRDSVGAARRQPAAKGGRSRQPTADRRDQPVRRRGERHQGAKPAVEESRNGRSRRRLKCKQARDGLCKRTKTAEINPAAHSRINSWNALKRS